MGKINYCFKLLGGKIFPINKTITYVTATFLIGFAVYFMINKHNNTKHSSEYYQEQLIQERKSKLKNMVDMAHDVAMVNYRKWTTKEHLEEIYGRRLQNIVDIVESYINMQLKAVDKGMISSYEAQRRIKQFVFESRYDKNGYVWINDMQLPIPRMVMHPTNPELNGKLLDNPKYNCVVDEQKNLFVKAVELCKTDNHGFFKYLWGKPGENDEKSFHKLSYVRHIPEFNWVVGTGIYIDHALEDCKQTIKENLRTIRYDEKKGYFWINDMDSPFPNIIMHPYLADLKGEQLNAKKYETAKDGKNIWAEFRIAVQDDRDGFVFYKFDKQSALGKLTDVPKLAYVRLFKPFNWIIGTGIYLDDIDQQVERMKKDQAKISGMFIPSIIAIAVISNLLLFLGLFYSTPKKRGK